MTPRKSPHGRPGHAPAREKKHIVGIIQVTRRGVGYVPWEGHDDIEIAPEALTGALNGDEVAVEVRKLFPRPAGAVAKVVARAKEEFVCTLAQTSAGLRAVPDDQRFYRPIALRPGGTELAAGAKALVRLLSFDGTQEPQGELIEVIGRAGEHRTEMNAIVLEHGFATTFPSEVAREAKEVEANHANEIAAQAAVRADYRAITTLTIDPKDAKDFDDALSLKELPDGTYEVGVHIADVTHFVREGSALEAEAQKRGTSVYLVDATIPMLPHELSGNVCSLKQGEDRLAFSAVFRLSEQGEVLGRRFERSIICSDKRFTYEEAQQVLDTQEGPFVRELNVLRGLARILKEERARRGAIDFGDNEVRFELDAQGVPLRVVRKERIETNSLIEEFMLLANREVAHHVASLAARVPEKNLVFLYRIHDQPKEDRIEELATFVRAVGYDFNNAKKKKYTARDIAQLLKQIAGTPEEHLIRTATLRSMAKAIYSTKNIGHFGLAFEYYTHFTSPIRRYPDMLVHRILASHLSGNPMTRREFDNLEKLCIAASLQEAKAVDAERDSIRYKQVEYLAQKIGKTFEGTISGVTDWGLYVEEKESAAEGLVRVKTIGGDFYTHRQKEYALVGERTKKKFTLGDKVNVRLVAADLSARTLDFELVFSRTAAGHPSDSTVPPPATGCFRRG